MIGNLGKSYAWQFMLIAVLFISGCQMNEDGTLIIDSTKVSGTTPSISTGFPTMTPSSSKTSTLEPSLTPTVRPTATNEPTPTLVPVDGPFPDILLNLGTGVWDECLKDGKNQIWISSYPYEKYRLLLADPNVDFNFPKWSPNGEMIAFIESIPVEIVEGGDLSITGTDTVWIMNSDGSGSRPISNPVKRVNYRFGDNCWNVASIISSLQWSPDSAHISFTQFDQENLTITYYLVNVAQGTSARVYIKNNSARISSLPAPTWLSNSEVVFATDDNGLIIFDLETQATTLVAPPSELSDPAVLGFTQNRNYHLQILDNRLYVDFLDKDNDFYHSLWQLELQTLNWALIIEPSPRMWGNPLIAHPTSIACGLDGIIYSINDNWEISGSYAAPNSNSRICVNLQSFQQGEYSYLSYSFTLAEDRVVREKGVWVTPIQSRDFAPILLVDMEEISKDVGKLYTTLIDYSWKP